jgi:two-component sensor histidine kinase
MFSHTTDFHSVLCGMPQPYLVLDNKLVIVGASDAYLALTARAREDIVGRHILDAFPENPDALGTVEQGPLGVSLRHVLATGRPHEMAVIQYDIPNADGGFTQKFWTPVHTPVLHDNGTVDYIIQNPVDVTESVVKERESDARLRVAHHAANLGSWEYEPETDIWRRSHDVDEMFGFEPGEGGPVAAPFFARMHPDDLSDVTQIVRSVMGSPDETVMNFDYRIVGPAGDLEYIASRGEVLRTSSGKVRMIGVLMDVTTDRLREAELAQALAAQGELLVQKDLLLAEVNHRVKNSLQLVVSTLRLQARRLQDPATSEVFDQAISRVRAIISVHERLYRTADSLSVDMADHLTKLCRDSGGDLRLRPILVEAGAIMLPTELAIPVSIIVNELLTRALRQVPVKDLIVVSMNERSPGFVELAVTGAGENSTDKVLLTELGARLITTMVAQIGGTFHDENANDGIRSTVRFQRNVC